MRIEIEELKFPIQIEHEVAGEYGMGSHKRIVMDVNVDRYSESIVNWSVYSHNVLVIKTRMLSVALEAFNETK